MKSKIIDKLLDIVSLKDVSVGKLVRITAGGRHGWYESNVGLIRKPLK